MTRGTVIEERFLVEAVIGAGAFGVVYRAVDYSLGQVVALKMVKPTGADRRTLIQRFAREARISSALQHPNTARLVHFGQWRVREGERPLPYMALELVRGFPLSALVKHRGQLTPDEAAWVALGILESLGEAHELGILHRDLKPDNVMVVAPESSWRNLQDSGPFHARLGIPPLEDPLWTDLRGLHVKVVDFGLGKLMAGGASFDVLTATGIVAGTAQYMSPEQVAGSKDLDGRADLYALAALLYRVLTGAPLFDGADDLAVALKHITEALPELPAPLDQHPIAAVYHRAGAKDREQRFATASEMAWALRAVPVGWTPPPPEPPPPPETPGLLGRLLGKLRS